MRIDFVTDTFPPDVNGVAMTLGRLVGGLRERGHLVHVLHTAEREGSSGETSLPSLPLPGYKEVRLGLPGRYKLFNRWYKKPPDAVYVATESPLGYSAIKAANMLQIPVAAGFHTNFDQYLSQYNLGGLRQAMLTFLRRVHNRADCTFAPSKEVVDRLQEEGFEEVYLLGRGVDTSLFNPGRSDESLRQKWGACENSKVVIVVGRVAPEKNLPLAVEAMEKMRAQHPSIVGVVVGDGPIKEELARRNPWLHFAGVREGEELARHYASADVLLFPSETETFGNVLIEGLASGLVTVSYDYAAASKHVEHGINGLKAPLGDGTTFILRALEALEAEMHHGMREKAVESVKGLAWSSVIDTFAERLQLMSERKINARNVQRGKGRLLSYRTIFISDVHLGTQDCRVKEAVDFLKHTRCEKLVLNGDIIDPGALKRGGKWKKSHTRFIRTVLKKSEIDETEVLYLRGNHDDVLDHLLPLDFGSIKVVKEHIHITPQGKKYLVIHGDGFNETSSDSRWIAAVGAIAYNLLLRANRLYNAYRAWRGKQHYALSKIVKSKVKGAASYLDRYREQLLMLATHRDCEGIICGHIHTPANEFVDGIHYLNSGDWVESLSAVVEHYDGTFEVIHYRDFLIKLQGNPLLNDANAADQGSQEHPHLADIAN